MKKLIILAFLATAWTTLNAQTTAGTFRTLPPAQKAAIITDSLRTLLQLTPEQYPKVQEILQQEMTEVAPVIRSDAGRAAKAKKLRSITELYQTKMKTVLTEGQWLIYEQKRKALIAHYRDQARD